MILGVPREIKAEEYRVALTPSGVRELVDRNHQVLIEQNAGVGSGFSDTEYAAAGARIEQCYAVFEEADLILKVKEPLPEEFERFRKESSLFTFLHLAPNPPLLEFLLKNEITALSYETLEIDNRRPLLEPMSEIAGKMAPLVGAYHLQKYLGGRGILPAGAIGTAPARCLVLGAGIVGRNAARISHGLGMDTVVMNINDGKLQLIDSAFQGDVKTLILSRQSLADELPQADLVIGAILVSGGRTPVLISRNDLIRMKKGSVIVDVSVDQGGCFETIHATTHSRPVYEVDGVLHYAVANMPGAFPRTSTLALTNATLPYIVQLADNGIERALEDPVLATALNVRRGEIILKKLREC